jgi:hypothetical protein
MASCQLPVGRIALRLSKSKASDQIRPHTGNSQLSSGTMYCTPIQTTVDARPNSSRSGLHTSSGSVSKSCWSAQRANSLRDDTTTIGYTNVSIVVCRDRERPSCVDTNQCPWFPDYSASRALSGFY